MLYQYSAKLQKVVDGDTVDLVVDLGFSINVTMRFRLDGIDAPEMKAPTLVEGKSAKEHLGVLLADANNGVIYVDSLGRDKYGRWVAKLTMVSKLSGAMLDVNKQMISDGFAVAYVP